MGLMLATRSIDLELLRRNTLGLAKIAKLFGIPTLLTAGGARGRGGRGFNGPVYPDIKQALPDAPLIERTALNAWAEPRVVRAVEGFGRRKLIMAGISTDICLTYATVMAADAGYSAARRARVRSWSIWRARSRATCAAAPCPAPGTG